MELAIAKYFGIRTHIIVPNLSYGLDGMHECDLFILRSSNYAIEVEIKRSKSDLLNDFKKKHDHGDERICELYFAIPIELLNSCEEHIPKHCGIIICEYKTYGKVLRARIHRNAIRNKNSRKLTSEEQFKVARLGAMRIWSLKEKIVKLQNKK
jgi:hypothetical protein